MQKKGVYPNWEKWGPNGFWTWNDVNVEFNLDWCDIFNNPESFLESLYDITGYRLYLDQYTTTAIDQYKKSCDWMYNKDSLVNNQFFQAWSNYCFEYRTNPNDDPDNRLSQSQALIHKTIFLPQ